MRYAIGVDIGGTKIEAVLVNKHGKILSRYRTQTQANKSKAQIVSNIVSAIKEVKTKKIQGIGVGVPGIAKNGKIVFMPNVSKLIGSYVQER